MARHTTEASSTEEIVVKIGTLGGALTEYLLPAGSTVKDALEKAGFPEGSTVRINGENYEDGDELDNGDRLTVIAGATVKGGNA